MSPVKFLLRFLVLSLGFSSCDFSRHYSYDVVVFGATPAGIISAVAAAREGSRVALVEPSNHFGGMVTGGLSHTDIGNISAIGGYTLEFFKHLGTHYQAPIAWNYEPHVAEKTFRDLLREAGVRVFQNQPISKIKKRGSTILSLRTLRQVEFSGKIFIDASYEADLLALSGASYTWGREAVDIFRESLAGVQRRNKMHQFDHRLDPYDASKNFLPGIQHASPPAPGAGDKRMSSYNFRVCLSRDPHNQVSLSKEPQNYNEQNYELLARYFEARPHTWVREILRLLEMPNEKRDLNSKGPFSTTLVGENVDYPEGTRRTRRAIWRRHLSHVQGLLYFLTTSPRVPENIRTSLRQVGLCKDEFHRTGHWPPQLYVREARRLTGEYVMTEHDVRTQTRKSDAIGMGSYRIEAHHAQRYVDKNGHPYNEGYFTKPLHPKHPNKPYDIPYRSITPRKHEVANLLVPVAVSATHVAYNTIRMEPVYMILGHSAGVAAHLAHTLELVVQDIPIDELLRRLASQHQVTSSYTKLAQ